MNSAGMVISRELKRPSASWAAKLCTSAPVVPPPAISTPSPVFDMDSLSERYGADRLGRDFADKAIERAIQAATTSQDRKRIFCPAGVYRISRPIVLKQAHGVSFVGAGSGATVFKVSGSITSPVFDLNGVSNCTFGGFSVMSDTGHDGPSSFDSGVRYWWDGTWNPSTGNTFRDILVHSARFKVGIQVGSDEAIRSGLQEDQTFWYSCRAIGPGIAGVYDETWWQDGIRVGSGTHGNNLLHHFYGTISCGFQHGVREAAGEAIFLGGCVQSNKVDWMFSSTGPASKFWKVVGIRSENSGRFISSAGSSSVSSQVSFENVEFCCVPGDVAADSNVIDYQFPGTLSLRNFTIVNHDPSYHPRIRYGGLCLMVDGMDVGYGDPDDLFEMVGGGSAVVTGVKCTGAGGITTDATSFGDGVRVLSETGRGLRISHKCGPADVGVAREGGSGPGTMVLDHLNGIMPFGRTGPRWLYGADVNALTSLPKVDDIVWTKSAASGGYVGRVFTADGWKQFGKIEE